MNRSIAIRMLIPTIATAIFMNSCAANKRAHFLREHVRVDNCREKWAYRNLQETVEISVLIFNRRINYMVDSVTIPCSPNFYIGISNKGDTIGVVDRDYDGQVNIYDTISVSPISVRKDDIRLYEPSHPIYKRKSFNDLYCSINTIYYGSVRLVKSCKEKKSKMPKGIYKRSSLMPPRCYY